MHHGEPCKNCEIRKRRRKKEIEDEEGRSPVYTRQRYTIMASPFKPNSDTANRTPVNDGRCHIGRFCIYRIIVPEDSRLRMDEGHVECQRVAW